MLKGTFEVVRNDDYIDLRSYQYGYEECVPLHSFGPVKRNHFLFHYIFAGKGCLASNGEEGEKKYNLESGHGFMIWPSQVNSYFADEKSPWKYGWVEFDGLRVQQLVTQSGLTFNHPVYISKDNKEKKKMVEELTWIINSKNSSSNALIGHLHLFLDALINSSSRQKKLSDNSMQEFYANEAINFIQQNYHKCIGIENISSYCKLDRSYLAKIFKSKLNTTPHDFLIRYRLSRACDLMKTTNLTINEISSMVGYPYQFSFSRIFRSFMGQSPKEWRSMNKFL
jgi:AraC-like DNA-binding protein